MSNEGRALYLLSRILDNQAMEAELVELAELLRSDETGLLTSKVTAQLDRVKADGAFSDRDWDAVATRILQADKIASWDKRSSNPTRLFYFGKRAAAAAVILLLVGGTYFLLTRPPKPEMAKTGKPEKGSSFDILPGGNKAILTLSNGTRITLDSTASGQIAQQGNVSVQKSGTGQLAYQVLESKATAVLYNTLQTPRSGVYRLTLPDGSRVWLNAESSIKYPVYFAGRDREVEVSGEAYFEVAKDAAKPFKVAVHGKAVVDVLGTDFNINAYNDETAIKTTLLEGSVKVSIGEKANLPGVNGGNDRDRGQQAVILKPGQQAQLMVAMPSSVVGRMKVVKDADIDQVIAWKNGFFNFNQVDLQAVMRQLARWYDVDVVYERDIPKIRFVGEMQRDLNLSDVLDVLKRTDVHFRIEGRKIIVLP